VACEVFVNPEAFLSTTAERLRERTPNLSETLELRDGRVFERDHVPIAGPGDVLRGHLWHYRDVTAARAAEKELARIRRQAELATVAKNEFLAMMSHEIRTPLSAIVGLANLLNSDLSESLRRDFLRRLDSNARSLLHLVETNLDLARIEADDLALAPRPFDPWSVADEVTSSLGASATDKGLDIFVIPAQSTVPSVVGDVHRIRQVLLNLVGNAIKFTPSGHIRIGIATEGSDEGSVMLTYSVADTGPGIPPHLQERIFERYVRADGNETGRGRGVGLGLAICKRLIAAMGGRIAVRSSPGEGAEFIVSIPTTAHDEQVEMSRPLAGLHVMLPNEPTPLTAALGAIASSLGGTILSSPQGLPEGARAVAFAVSRDAARTEGLARCERVFFVANDARGDDDTLLPPVTRSSVMQRLERQPITGRRTILEPRREALRVLLVDDDDDGRDVLSHVLSRLGHRVVSVSNAYEALAVLAERVPDIILTDLRMPGMSGVELIRRIRNDEAQGRAERIPIIALSADALSSRRDEALAAGADRFVAKPVGTTEIDELIDSLIDRRPRVLILDDAPDMRLLLRFLLQREPRWRIAEAVDLASAQKAVATRRFDLVLADLGLPDAEGAEVVRALRAAGGRRPPVVVVLSGRDADSVRAACTAAGANRFLLKPVDPTTLLSTLGELLP
jgi:two-component system sensor histidine kinase/response regulator